MQNMIATANAKYKCNAFLYPSPIVFLSYSSSVYSSQLSAFRLSQLGKLRLFFSDRQPPSAYLGLAFHK